MDMKQFTGFCYDEIAESLGFFRIINRYYKVEEDAVASFALEKWAGQRLVRPLLQIQPLCAITSKGSTNEMIQVEPAFHKHTTKNYHDMSFNSRTALSDCLSLKQYLLEIFHESQKPFLVRVKDLQSGLDAYLSYREYHYEGAAIIPAYNKDYNLNNNYWLFLLALKKYDEALINFELAARDYKIELLWENQLCGQMHRLLRNQQYKEIDEIITERTKQGFNILHG